MEKHIYDSDRKIVGYISKDTVFDSDHKIIGYIRGNDVVDAPQYGKIICRISEDGTVTQGTSNAIASRISDDGTVTEGTSHKIVGYIEVDEVSAGRGKGGGGIIAILSILFAFLLWFGVAEMPRVFATVIEDLVNEENIEGIVTFAITILSILIGGIFSNVSSSKSNNGFFARMVSCYVVSAVVATVCIIVLLIVTGSINLLSIVAAPIVSIVLCVIPTIVLSIIFSIIQAIK